MNHLGPIFGDPGALVLTPDDEAGDVLKKDERDAAEIAELDEMRRLERGLREEHAVVGDDADEQPVQAGEPRDERGAVPLLELVEARSVDEAREDLADLVGMSRVGVDDAVDLAGVVAGILGRGHVGRHPLDELSVLTIVRARWRAWASSSAK